MASEGVLESQNQLRLQNIGCDVIFDIGAKSFPAHRIVLMARVEHFRSMFTADMREKKELVIPFDPQIIDSTIFGHVLDYIYTFKIEFTAGNLGLIFKAADYLCFNELTTKAKEHMESSLKIENAVLYRNISVEFNLKSFEDRCEQFIIDNLSSDIIKNQLIPTLSFEELKGFIEKLKKSNKFEDMFNYSVDWILQDKPNRIETFSELFKNIPLKSLPFRFIKQTVSNNEIVLKDVDCLALLLKTVLTISEPFHSLNTSDARESQSEVLYAIGGRDGPHLSSVSEYSNATNKWTASTPMPSPRAAFGCAVIGRKIYVCGGHNGRSMNSLTVFDTDTQTWTQLTPMKYARYHCATAVLTGQIYIAGGWNGTERLTIVERYDVQTNRWQNIAPMTTKRGGLELVALNGFLYAIGGFDGSNRLNSVERYDPQTDQWTRMNNINNEYSSFGSAVWNSNIYIVGNGNDKCEVYSPADDKWTEMPAPTKCDYGRQLAVYDNKLYAIGGRVEKWDEWKGIKTVEMFDFQARVWRQEQDMDVARCFHQLAVVKR